VEGREFGVRRVRWGVHEVQWLDDRARPAMGEDQRVGVCPRRLQVQEVKIEPVNLAQCLAVRVELGLGPAPVITARPVVEQVDDVAARRSGRAVGVPTRFRSRGCYLTMVFRCRTGRCVPDSRRRRVSPESAPGVVV